MNQKVGEGVVATDLSGAQWHKSSYSNGQANCVEVATNLLDVVAVRDSKHPKGHVLLVRPTAWQQLLHSIRAC